MVLANSLSKLDWRTQLILNLLRFGFSKDKNGPLFDFQLTNKIQKRDKIKRKHTKKKCTCYKACKSGRKRKHKHKIKRTLDNQNERRGRQTDTLLHINIHPPP